jgi:hypothetical protein
MLLFILHVPSSFSFFRIPYATHHSLFSSKHPLPSLNQLSRQRKINSFSTSPSVMSVSIVPSSSSLVEGSPSPCRIKVIGVGGGGGNAINRMMETSAGTILGVDLWSVNTDAQALSRNLAKNKLIIGNMTSK